MLINKQTVKCIDIGFGAGDDNIGIGTPAGIGYTIALYPNQHLANGINTLGNRFDSKFSQLIGHPDEAVNRLVDGIYRTGTKGSISQNFTIGGD